MCDEVRNCEVLLAVRHFVITVLVLAVSIPPVSGQASELIETFDNPTLSSWEHSADVTVANGIVLIPTNGFLAVPGVWGDFSLVTDGATTWQKLGNNLPFTNVRGLALSASSSVLYAGTVGSGVYRLGTP